METKMVWKQSQQGIHLVRAQLVKTFLREAVIFLLGSQIYHPFLYIRISHSNFISLFATELWIDRGTKNFWFQHRSLHWSDTSVFLHFTTCCSVLATHRIQFWRSLGSLLRDKVHFGSSCNKRVFNFSLTDKGACS